MFSVLKNNTLLSGQNRVFSSKCIARQAFSNANHGSLSPFLLHAVARMETFSNSFSTNTKPFLISKQQEENHEGFIPIHKNGKTSSNHKRTGRSDASRNMKQKQGNDTNSRKQGVSMKSDESIPMAFASSGRSTTYNRNARNADAVKFTRDSTLDTELVKHLDSVLKTRYKSFSRELQSVLKDSADKQDLSTIWSLLDLYANDCSLQNYNFAMYVMFSSKQYGEVLDLFDMLLLQQHLTIDSRMLEIVLCTYCRMKKVTSAERFLTQMISRGYTLTPDAVEALSVMYHESGTNYSNWRLLGLYNETANLKIPISGNVLVNFLQAFSALRFTSATAMLWLTAGSERKYLARAVTSTMLTSLAVRGLPQKAVQVMVSAMRHGTSTSFPPSFYGSIVNAFIKSGQHNLAALWAEKLNIYDSSLSPSVNGTANVSPVFTMLLENSTAQRYQRSVTGILGSISRLTLPQSTILARFLVEADSVDLVRYWKNIPFDSNHMMWIPVYHSLLSHDNKFQGVQALTELYHAVLDCPTSDETMSYRALTFLAVLADYGLAEELDVFRAEMESRGITHLPVMHREAIRATLTKERLKMEKAVVKHRQSSSSHDNTVSEAVRLRSVMSMRLDRLREYFGLSRVLTNELAYVDAPAFESSGKLWTKADLASPKDSLFYPETVRFVSEKNTHGNSQGSNALPTLAFDKETHKKMVSIVLAWEKDIGPKQAQSRLFTSILEELAKIGNPIGVLFWFPIFFRHIENLLVGTENIGLEPSTRAIYAHHGSNPATSSQGQLQDASSSHGENNSLSISPIFPEASAFVEVMKSIENYSPEIATGIREKIPGFSLQQALADISKPAEVFSVGTRSAPNESHQDTLPQHFSRKRNADSEMVKPCITDLPVQYYSTPDAVPFYPSHWGPQPASLQSIGTYSDAFGAYLRTEKDSYPAVPKLGAIPPIYNVIGIIVDAHANLVEAFARSGCVRETMAAFFRYLAVHEKFFENADYGRTLLRNVNSQVPEGTPAHEASAYATAIAGTVASQPIDMAVSKPDFSSVLNGVKAQLESANGHGDFASGLKNAVTSDSNGISLYQFDSRKDLNNFHNCWPLVLGLLGDAKQGLIQCDPLELEEYITWADHAIDLTLKSWTHEIDFTKSPGEVVSELLADLALLKNGSNLRESGSSFNALAARPPPSASMQAAILSYRFATGNFAHASESLVLNEELCSKLNPHSLLSLEQGGLDSETRVPKTDAPLLDNETNVNVDIVGKEDQSQSNASPEGRFSVATPINSLWSSFLVSHTSFSWRLTCLYLFELRQALRYSPASYPGVESLRSSPSSKQLLTVCDELMKTLLRDVPNHSAMKFSQSLQHLTHPKLTFDFAAMGSRRQMDRHRSILFEKIDFGIPLLSSTSTSAVAGNNDSTTTGAGAGPKFMLGKMDRALNRKESEMLRDIFSIVHSL